MSQRERLLSRARPQARYRLLVDPDGAERARSRLSEAQSAVRRARIAGQPDQIEAAQREVEAAQRELDACYEVILLQALPPDRVERLIAEHPPTSEQMATAKTERDRARQRGDEPPPWPSWNDETFRPALLAESAVEAGMTPDDWAEFLRGCVSAGEARDLWRACLSVQHSTRVADPVVLPKGLMEILNSP